MEKDILAEVNQSARVKALQRQHIVANKRQNKAYHDMDAIDRKLTDIRRKALIKYAGSQGWKVGAVIDAVPVYDGRAIRVVVQRIDASVYNDGKIRLICGVLNRSGSVRKVMTIYPDNWILTVLKPKKIAPAK